MGGRAVKPFELVVYLFCEGETESRYVQELVRDLKLGSRIRVIPAVKVSTPIKLLEKALQWLNNSARSLKSGVPKEMWLIFDNDERPEELQRMVGFLRREEAQKAVSKFNLRFGWMSPSIEVWALLHVLDASKIPTTHTSAQHQLKGLMPGYDHAKAPWFILKPKSVFTEPEAIQCAIEKARQLERTHGSFPECLETATHYAGIYPLIVRILSIFNVQG